MLRLIGERYDFSFNRRTIPGTDTLNLTIVKRRVGKTSAEYFTSFGIGVDDIALTLAQ